MELPKGLLLSTCLIVCCLSGFNHARAMQNKVKDVSKLPPKDSLWNAVTSQAAFSNLEANLNAFIKLLDNVGIRGKVQTVPDTGGVLHHNIEDVSQRHAMEMVNTFDKKPHSMNDRHSEENDRNEFSLINNQPLAYPELIETKSNAVDTENCISDGSNNMCENRKNKTDIIEKTLINIVHLKPTQSNQTRYSKTKTLTGGQLMEDGFLRNKNHETSDNYTSRNIQKRQFRRPNLVTCNLDTIDMDLRFSENIETETGSYVLMCSGSVAVNKCEGLCSSNVSPSVNHVDGFEKICACCRDSSVRTRGVTLTSCVLGTQDVVGYALSRDVVEPMSCECKHCRN